MGEFPFQLLIKNTFSGNKEESLTCTGLLRVVAGRREVYDALWNGRGIIVKVFSHKISAKRHLKREWRGLSLLQARGLNSPKPLFTGRTKDGRWAVVLEKIADVSTILDILNEKADKTQKLELLALVCKELAKENGRGVLQKDLHLGNFVLGGDKVFVLDVGQMQFFSHQINRRRSISQLAWLVCYLPISDAASIAKLSEKYFKARGWRFTKTDEALLKRNVRAHRQKGVDRALKKCLRTSKRHLRIKSGGYLAVFDRGFCQGAEPLDFIERIDELMDSGRILKNGNTCYVSGIRWNGRDVVVKRYNHKGFIHSLRHTIKKSRAHRGWLHGHQLGMLKIATPKPIVYIEQRRGMLVWESYLVTEYVQGHKLHDFLRDGKIGEEERSKVTQQIKELLADLEKYRIIHGDLKHSNILITDSGPVLTDLDAMKLHKWNWTYQMSRRKDLVHFNKNVQCHG